MASSRRGVGAFYQCPLGSVASYLIYADVQLHIAMTHHNDTGLCGVYDPPVSYWCSQHPSGGGAFAFRTPSGLTPLKGALPNSPYKNPSTALFNVRRW